jgi:hypothetical protein
VGHEGRNASFDERAAAHGLVPAPAKHRSPTVRNHAYDTRQVPAIAPGAEERALYQAHFRAKSGVLRDADLLHSLGDMAGIQVPPIGRAIKPPRAPRRR